MPSSDREIQFYKMQGSGNDFVLLNNDTLRISQSDMPLWAQKICRRSFGVGADGLIFLQSAADDPDLDYRWHFYNADGSRAEMCGNGSRCAAKLAYGLGLAPARHVLGTDAGPVQADVLGSDGQVRVQLTRPEEYTPHLQLSLDDGQQITAHLVNTGVPHVVYFTDQAEQEVISSLGPAIRYHHRFAPAGANVNLVQVLSRDSLLVRTYERGVEDETYACGTGAAASAFVAHKLEKVDPQVHVTTSGGEHLQISLDQDQVFLQGQAVLVYTGQLVPDTLGLDW